MGWCALWRYTRSLEQLVYVSIILPWSFKRIRVHARLQLVCLVRLPPLTLLVPVMSSS